MLYYILELLGSPRYY